MLIFGTRIEGVGRWQEEKVGRLTHSKDISWWQRARSIWLKEVDTNTSFFNRMANAQRKDNHISRLSVDGKVLTREEDISKTIVEFYSRLDSEPNVGTLIGKLGVSML